jgi:hypothetical protein
MTIAADAGLPLGGLPKTGRRLGPADRGIPQYTTGTSRGRTARPVRRDDRAGLAASYAPPLCLAT